MQNLLIVDDTATNINILSMLLKEEDYQIATAQSGAQAMEEIGKKTPSLILMDIKMPDTDGYDLCREIKNNAQYEDIPVIFISALHDFDDKVKGFDAGAVDFITKPFHAAEVKMRVRTHMKIKCLQERLEKHNSELQTMVEEKVQQLANTQMETIFSLAKLAQSRDDDTGKHLERVQQFCQLLATELKQSSQYTNEISDDFVKNIMHASPLHDIGKVGIPDAILLKPSKLTDEEFELMKNHTTIGSNTLEEVIEQFGANDFIFMGKVIARSHHERWDGKGYPDKLNGADIPLAARIMSIADVYDALRAKRVYKEGFTHEKSKNIILEGEGTQFDPVITEAFASVADKFEQLYEELKD